MYFFLSLFNILRDLFFTFEIAYPNIYFISFAKLCISTSSRKICSYIIRLYEFETLLAETFPANKNIPCQKTTISFKCITVYTFIFQNIIKPVSISTVIRPVYSPKNCEIPIEVSCIIHRRMIVIFIKYSLYEFCQVITIFNNF